MDPAWQCAGAGHKCHGGMHAARPCNHQSIMKPKHPSTSCRNESVANTSTTLVHACQCCAGSSHLALVGVQLVALALPHAPCSFPVLQPPAHSNSITHLAASIYDHLDNSNLLSATTPDMVITTCQRPHHRYSGAKCTDQQCDQSLGCPTHRNSAFLSSPLPAPRPL